MNNTGEKTLCVGKDKVMGNGVTIIVGAGAVLDFDHKGIFPSVKNITDEVLKLNIQKVDGGERPLLREINDFIVGKLNQVGRPEINRYVPSQLNLRTCCMSSKCALLIAAAGIRNMCPGSHFQSSEP